MGSHCHRLGGEYRKNASISNGNNIDIGKNQKKIHEKAIHLRHRSIMLGEIYE